MRRGWWVRLRSAEGDRGLWRWISGMGWRISSYSSPRSSHMTSLSWRREGEKDVELQPEVSQWEPHAKTRQRERGRRGEQRRGGGRLWLKHVTPRELSAVWISLDMFARQRWGQDVGKELTGRVLVVWSWERHTGIQKFQRENNSFSSSSIKKSDRGKRDVKCNLETKLQQARLAEPP